MDNLLFWMPAAIGLAGLISGLVVWSLSRVFVPKKAGSESSRAALSNTFDLHAERLIRHDVDGWSADAPFETWGELQSWLEPRFADLPRTLSALLPEKEIFCPAKEPDDPACVSIVRLRDENHRVTLFDPKPMSPAQHHYTKYQIAQAESFKSAIMAAPLAVCCVDQDEKRVWQNKAFDALAQSEQRQILSDCDQSTESAAKDTQKMQERTAHHFEVTKKNDSGLDLIFAKDVTQQVQSDNSRGSFIQTLTKTFAELSVGLAVFDKNRQLVLFNPALTDLTRLPVDFLSCRPNLMDFFDRLRDNQVLPEPKSYATWRSQISSIIDTTEHGHYSESWSLPTGLTYRVTGRPHPDGSVAFLIEDISDEMSLTRRYRTQLDMRQSVLNRVSEAVAVVSPTGVVVFSNDAFASLLGKAPDEAVSEMRAADLFDACRHRFPHPVFWKQAQALVEHGGQARKLQQVLGNGVECRLERLRGRFLFVGIRESVPAQVMSA